MALVTEFYSNLEDPIREIVRILRDNGINTTCSCGHEMYVEADLIPDGQLQVIHNTLYNYFAENNLPLHYTIELRLEVRDGYLFRCFAFISIGKEKANGNDKEETL